LHLIRHNNTFQIRKNKDHAPSGRRGHYFF
jgi:hypothetical protein